MKESSATWMALKEVKDAWSASDRNRADFTVDAETRGIEGVGHGGETADGGNG